MQNELQKIIVKNISEELILAILQNQAFSNAIKLDCMRDFNKLSLHVAYHKDNPQIQENAVRVMRYFGNLDLSNNTIEKAKIIREEMLSEICGVLEIRPSKNARNISQQERLREEAKLLRNKSMLTHDSQDALQDNVEQGQPESLSAKFNY